MSGANVTLDAADSGSVSVTADGTVTAVDGDAKLTAEADVMVAGMVTAKNNATVEATSGAVVTTAAIEATDGKAAITAGTDATIGGTVTAGTDAAVTAGDNATVNGDVTAQNNATVTATAGAVETTAAIEATDGDAALTAGTDVSVTDNAKIDAGANAALTANGGDVTVDGSASVTAGEGATLTGSKGVDVLDGATVSANGGDATLTAQGEDVRVTGAVTASGNATVDAATTVEVSDDGAVSAVGDAALTAGTDVSVTDNAKIDAGANAALTANGGDVTVDGSASVTAGGNASLAADSVVKVSDNAAVTAGGNASVAANNGDVTVGGAASVAADGNASLEAGSGVNVADEAAVTAGGNAFVAANKGDVTVAGAASVKAGEGATLTGSKGVDVLDGASVTADDAVLAARSEDVLVTGSVMASGNANVSAATAVEVSDDGSIKAGGNTSLVGGTDVTVTDKASVTAGGSASLVAGNGIDVLGNGVVKAGDTVKVSAPSGVEVSGVVEAGRRLDANGQNVSVDDSGSVSAPTIDVGKLTTSGTIKSSAINGTIEQNNGVIEAMSGDLTLNGDVLQNGGTIEADHLTLQNGDVIQSGDAAQVKAEELEFGNSGEVALVSANNEIARISGNVGSLDFVDKDDLAVGELAVSDALKITTGGSTSIEGPVSAGSTAEIDAGRDVAFLSGGKLTAGSAIVHAGGNITQEGASVSVKDGYANEAHLDAAIQAGNTELSAGGNIGGGTYRYVVVGGGPVKASAGGSASVASAGSEDLRVTSVSARNVSLYTAGKLITDGPVSSSGGSTTITAKGFGGIAKSIFGFSLTDDNFILGSSPLLAIFETVGGNKTPWINNQPNGAIIFIDGRLAGGDIKTINKLGSLEAFPVQTPELKSEQGVFGNPIFLHDELDVANPFAVGAIDYLLQDIPLLMLTSDFPMEVDKQVAANGLNPTTSYWFGQHPQEEPEEPADGEEKKGEGKGK